jgi:hypothetical protein
VPEVAIMIEGQDGLDWPRWQRLARTVEDSGYAALHRSDHFTNPTGPVLHALELWSSLTWLADNTDRIEFGPLVSPVSFRHPVITAWTASSVDSLAGGRLRLGIGAGWQEREHEAHGFELLETELRFARWRTADSHRRQRPAAHPAAGCPLRRRVERRPHTPRAVRRAERPPRRAIARGRAPARSGAPDADDAGNIRAHYRRRRAQARGKAGGQASRAGHRRRHGARGRGAARPAG